MRRQRIRSERSLFLLSALMLFPSATQAQQKPEIPETVAQFWKRVDRAKTLSFTVKKWEQEVHDPEVYTLAPGKYLFHVIHVYEIQAQRPNRIAIRCTPALQEAELYANGKGQKQFGDFEHDLYINDGKQSIALNAHLHIYTLGPGLTSLDLSKWTREERTKVKIFNSTDMELIFDPRHWDGFKREPDASLLIEGADPISLAENPVVYLLEDPGDPNQNEKIYFDRKTGQLLRCSEFFKDKNGEWKESSRWEFRFWDIDGPLPTGTFSTRPPRLYRTAEEFDKERKKLKAQQESNTTVSKQ